VAYRLFDKDIPTVPRRFTTAYFVTVLATLGLLLWLVPMQVLGKAVVAATLRYNSVLRLMRCRI
jgi:hypothetical protein